MQVRVALEGERGGEEPAAHAHHRGVQPHALPPRAGASLLSLFLNRSRRLARVTTPACLAAKGSMRGDF